MPRRRLSTLLACLIVALGASVPAAVAEPAAPTGAVAEPPAYDTTAEGAVEALRDDREIAPGVVLTSFESYDRLGFQRTHVLTATLEQQAITADLLGETVTGAQALTKHADAAGAIGAVNGDFFNINQTWAATGPEVRGGVFRKGLAEPLTVAGVGQDRVARLAEIFLEGTVTLPSGERPLTALNSSTIPANGIGLYTPAWGPGSRTFVQADRRTEVTVRDGKVTAVRSGASSDPVPSDGFVLLGAGSSADTLAALAPGDPATVAHRPRSTAPTPYQMAVSGKTVLLRGGAVQEIPRGSHWDDLHPRTAIGWTDGGRRLLLAALDGRSSSSRGATIRELADLMKRLGASDALELDGGGSTELVARLPGDRGTSIVNTPSDGGERSIPNGAGLFIAAGSGELRGFAVRTASERVFPGLTRSFTAHGHDETYAAVDHEQSSERWKVNPASLGDFVAPGVLRAQRSGSGEVRASTHAPGGAGQPEETQSGDGTGRGAVRRGEQAIEVLGPLAELEFSPKALSLEPGDRRTVRVVGSDAEGFTAPVEPRDLELDYDREVVSVTPQADGSLRVEGLASGDGRGTLLKASVGDVRTALPVTVGLKSEPLSDFEDGSRWSFSSVRATGSLGVVAAPDRPGAATGNRALRLAYDFRGQGSTSAAYANARPGPLTLPAGTQRLALWVKGDGRKHWLRATLRSRGTTNVPFTFSLAVDWTGWRRVEGVLPGGFAEPITLTQVYLVETSLTRKDAGEVLFDDLTARVGHSLEGPREQREDPFVIQQDESGKDRWRFALLSDTHTTAAAGRDSFSGRQTIEALKQIAAARPDFVLINGDAVDTNRPEDFAFFNTLLEEHLPAGLPVHWTPGNHESGSSSGGTLGNFTAGTGRPTRQVVDHRGTRFILMNSHLGSLRLSDWEEVRELEEALDAAVRDPAVESVVVAFHHPLTDPSGGGASQLSDGLEAQLVRRWLSTFREESGKNVAVLSGHAHTAAANRSDGVLEINSPAVGKTPYASADRGGFFGWMLAEVDPDPRRLRAERPDPSSLGWLRAEVRPIIDAAELNAPTALEAGDSAPLSADGITSGFGLRFPLRYPASVTWSGGGGLAVVRGEKMAADARRFRGTKAVLDLETMELSGVRPGTVSVRVSSGGLTREAEVRVEEAAAGSAPAAEPAAGG